MHLDELTPHLHTVVVPLTSNGRLSARDVVGNKQALQTLQDAYAEKMHPFGLERGLHSTGIKHEGARAYYARMEDKFSNDRERRNKSF